MSGTYEVLWVGDKTREWSGQKGGSFIDYTVKAKEPDGSEGTCTITRKVGGRPAPEVGQKIFGHIEEERVEPKEGQTFQAFTKRKLKEDTQEGSGGSSGGRQDPGPEFWAQKDRRLARAGIVQAIVNGAAAYLHGPPTDLWLDNVDQAADALLARLDQHAPSPNNDTGGDNGKAPVQKAPPIASGVATPAEKGATSRKLNELNVAPAIQTQLVHAVAGNPPTAEGLKVIEAAIALGDWASLFDERGIERPPHLPDTRGLPIGDAEGIPF